MKGDPDDCLTLVDIKTPATASLTWNLQTAAYVMLLREIENIHIQRRIALMLPKQGGQAKIVEFTNQPREEKLYLSALELYRYFNK